MFFCFKKYTKTKQNKVFCSGMDKMKMKPRVVSKVTTGEGQHFEVSVTSVA